VVRFGLYGIKNVGDAAVEHILSVRNSGGKFKDLWDFCKRIDSSVVNKRALEHLIKAGAFDKLGDRSQLLCNVEAAMRWGTEQRTQAAMGQFGLFASEELRPPALQGAEQLSNLELLRLEKEALGLYISAHPMQSYPGLAEAASCAVGEIETWYRGQPNQGRVKAVLTGLLQNVVKKPTKKGTMMARFEIADESGSREVLAFSRTYDEIAPSLINDVPVVVVIDLSPEGDALRLVADRLIRWDEEVSLPEVAVFEFDLGDISRHHLTDFRSYLDEYSGITPVQLRFKSPVGQVVYDANGVRVDKSQLSSLRDHCPWLRVNLTLDTTKLLRERGDAGYVATTATPQSEVPF
jgi:DNA polymerase III subunit alpha